MNKILLVYEDYTDLMNTEASLKKIGFDVVGVTNEYSLTEQVISFNPDVVVAYGRGGKVVAGNVGKKLKEMPRWTGKSILVFSANAKPSAQELIKIRADMMLEAPVPVLRLIQVLAKLLGHDESLLLERLNKIMHAESSAPTTTIVGSGAAPRPPGSERFFVGGAGEEEKRDLKYVVGNGETSGEEEDSASGKSSSLFGNLKNAQDLYRDERETKTESGETLFPDVDMQALERELRGETAPPVAKEVSFELADRAEESPDQSLLQAIMREEMAQAQKSVSEKVAKYSQMTQAIEVPATSTVRRVEARKRQRELVKDWDQKNIKEIDELRREFTTAMFKK